MAGMPRKEVVALLKNLEEQGAKLEEKKNGVMILFPDGTTAMTHWSTSDTNSFRPLRSAVLRAGLNWPGDKHPTRGERGIKPETLKVIRKAFYDNGHKPMALHEIVTATGLAQPTISRAAALGELERVKRGVWKLPEVWPPKSPAVAKPVAEPEVSETKAAEPKPEPEPKAAEPQGAPRTTKEGVDRLLKHPEWKGAATQREPQSVEFIDDRDSWTVDLAELSYPLTVRELVATYRAAGLGVEIRVWKEAL